MDCVFCNILEKKIPANILYEDKDVFVFPDIKPVRKVHLLIVPKKHIEDFLLVTDSSLFAKLFVVVQKMISREGLKDKGYRLVINGGGAQLVPHLHIHLMGPIGKEVSV